MGFFSNKESNKKEIIIGTYDELTQEPIGKIVIEGNSTAANYADEPPVDSNHCLEINEIARFVNQTLLELYRLKGYNIDNVDFKLNIYGNEVSFSTKLKIDN